MCQKIIPQKWIEEKPRFKRFPSVTIVPEPFHFILFCFQIPDPQHTNSSVPIPLSALFHSSIWFYSTFPWPFISKLYYLLEDNTTSIIPFLFLYFWIIVVTPCNTLITAFNTVIIVYLLHLITNYLYNTSYVSTLNLGIEDVKKNFAFMENYFQMGYK